MEAVSERVPLKGREDLSVFWDNHLRVAFEQAAAHDLPAMVEASLAHVIMLEECGSLPSERARLLLKGLLKLWQRWGDGQTTFEFDGTAEDPYYTMERELAAACGIEKSELNVQLARSRNDLDAAVFRMVLRRMILDQVDLLAQLIDDTATRAEETAEVLIIGQTHRRPAQPTTMAHVLCGLAEAWRSQADGLVSVWDEMNVSPLGGAAFTGTDIAISPERVAALLGFDRVFTSSYEAIAGAEHFMRLAGEHARIGATASRWARVLQEWMGLGWVKVPLAFTQGSSIMPQKVNPVVLEHLVSMGGAVLGDTTAVFANVGGGWYEDSNNATTDIQQHLWRSCDRTVRTLRLLDGLMEELAPANPPTEAEIVAAGCTTTSVAEALASRGAPWRGAHGAVGDLFRAAPPAEWDEDLVARTLAGHGLPAELAPVVLEAGLRPAAILARAGRGTPGTDATHEAVRALRAAAGGIRTVSADRRTRLDEARERLLSAVTARLG